MTPAVPPKGVVIAAFTVYPTTDNTTNVTCVTYVMCLQCYVMLCYVMLCYVMLCYVMLCYVTVVTVYIIYAMHLFKIYNYMLSFKNANAGEPRVNRRVSGYKTILTMHRNYTRSAMVPNTLNMYVLLNGTLTC